MFVIDTFSSKKGPKKLENIEGQVCNKTVSPLFQNANLLNDDNQWGFHRQNETATTCVISV